MWGGFFKLFGPVAGVKGFAVVMSEKRFARRVAVIPDAAIIFILWSMWMCTS